MLRSQSSPTPDAHAVRGYLNRFKTQLIGKSWEQRYFVLRYGQLHVHLSEREFTNSVSHNAPFSLRDCTIIDTGTRKQGRFHTFAISHPSRTWAYLGTQLGNHGGLFLRLSCESEAEKSQWLLMLRSAARQALARQNAKRQLADGSRTVRDTAKTAAPAVTQCAKQRHHRFIVN